MSKKGEMKIVHIAANNKTATTLVNTSVIAVLFVCKCQRWDITLSFAKCQVFLKKVLRNFFENCYYSAGQHSRMAESTFNPRFLAVSARERILQ